MAEATVTKSVRLPLHVADYLMKDGDGINQGINKAVYEIRTIKAISLSELKGVFTPGEWTFLADSLNGTMTTDSMRYIKGVLIAHNEDAEMYEGTATRHEVDVKALNEKIDKLYGAHIDAIYTRVEAFWEKAEVEDLKKWAVY